jgi:exodeoxyribonuclease VII large subunit
MENKERIWKLSEITKAIERIFKVNPGNKLLFIKAEISSVTINKKNKMCYLQLVEKADGKNDIVAEMRAVIWSDDFRIINDFEQKTNEKFTPGFEIAFNATISFHSKYGLSLFIKKIDAEYTLGKVMLSKALVKGKLIQKYPDKIIAQSGGTYMTPNKSIKFPLIIKKIALIAASDSKGREDFMTAIDMNRYNFKFDITFYIANVQGEDAERTMCNAIELIDTRYTDFDVIVIARGGGSPTSFMPFNSFNLSEKIAFAKIPVITGLGHSTDVSVSDLMANTMAMTPTEAAEMIISHNLDVLKELNQIKTNIIHKTQLAFNGKRKEFNAVKVNIYQNAKRYGKIVRQKMDLHKKSISVNAKNFLVSTKNELSSTKNTFTHKTKDTINSLRQKISKTQIDIYSKSKFFVLNYKLSISNFLGGYSSRVRLKIAQYKTSFHGEKLSLRNKFRSLILTNKSELESYRQKVRLLDQSSLLSRGYALVYKNGKIVTEPNDVKVGDTIKTRLIDVYIESKVISKSKKNG